MRAQAQSFRDRIAARAQRDAAVHPYTSVNDARRDDDHVARLSVACPSQDGDHHDCCNKGSKRETAQELVRCSATT